MFAIDQNVGNKWKRNLDYNNEEKHVITIPNKRQKIVIYFLAFLPSVTLPPAETVGPMGLPKCVKVPEPKHRAIARCEVCTSMYITYNLVSKFTPLAVTGPHGQLASLALHKKSHFRCRSPYIFAGFYYG